jgi:hypothetical protein
VAVSRRYRLCRFCGDMHQLGAWPHNCLPDRPARSDFPSPHVVSDSIGGVNGLFHHAALTRFDSKSAFRRATREHGCEEAGGERDAVERMNARARVTDTWEKDSTERAVNEALHQHGISSDSDTGKLDYGS